MKDVKKLMPGGFRLHLFRIPCRTGDWYGKLFAWDDKPIGLRYDKLIVI